MTAAIVDVKSCFKVIRHLMSNSVSKMPILGVFGRFFCVGGRDLLTFGGCIIKLHLDRILCVSMAGIRSVSSETTFRKKQEE